MKSRIGRPPIGRTKKPVAITLTASLLPNFQKLAFLKKKGLSGLIEELLVKEMAKEARKGGAS